MTQYLPPNLLALFAPRDPIAYFPPIDKLPHEKESQQYSGLSAFVTYFEDPKETPAPTRVETREERKERKRKERAEQTAYKLEQDLALWDPLNSEVARGDPFKTLFVSRINYDTGESKLRREFDEYGPIRRLVMVKNKETGKPRGYAFIEFEHERDMIDQTSQSPAAYKKADGKKIDGRRVLIDVERGRTVKGWRPRRLGGGLGNTRKGGNEVNTKYSGRDDFDGRDRLLPDDRDRSMRETSRDRRSRDRSRRSRSRDRERRKRSRERKRSPEVKKEPGEFGNDSARKRTRRSRSRDRHRSRSRDRKRQIKRSRSRSKGKKERVKTQVKEEMGEVGGPAPVKQEHQDGYYGDQAMHIQLPTLPNNANNNNNNNNGSNNDNSNDDQYG